MFLKEHSPTHPNPHAQLCGFCRLDLDAIVRVGNWLILLQQVQRYAVTTFCPLLDWAVQWTSLHAGISESNTVPRKPRWQMAREKLDVWTLDERFLNISPWPIKQFSSSSLTQGFCFWQKKPLFIMSIQTKQLEVIYILIDF